MKAEWEFSTEGSRERAFQKGETARIQASPGWEREKGPEWQLGVAGYVWTGTGGKVEPELPKEALNDSFRVLPGNYGQHGVRNRFVNTGVSFRACAAKMN